MSSGYGYDPIEIPETRCYETEDDMMQREVDDTREANAELVAALRTIRDITSPGLAATSSHYDMHPHDRIADIWAKASAALTKAGVQT